jgi:hypothetical protein
VTNDKSGVVNPKLWQAMGSPYNCSSRRMTPTSVSAAGVCKEISPYLDCNLRLARLQRGSVIRCPCIFCCVAATFTHESQTRYCDRWQHLVSLSAPSQNARELPRKFARFISLNLQIFSEGGGLRPRFFVSILGQAASVGFFGQNGAKSNVDSHTPAGKFARVE